MCSFLFLFFFGGGGYQWKDDNEQVMVRNGTCLCTKNEPEIMKIRHFLFYFNLYIFQFRVFLIKNSCQFLCLLHLMGCFEKLFYKKLVFKKIVLSSTFVMLMQMWVDFKSHPSFWSNPYKIQNKLYKFNSSRPADQTNDGQTSIYRSL